MKQQLKILDLYIIKKFLITFIFCVMGLAVIAVVIDLAEKMDKFISKNVATNEIVQYYVNFVPFITAYLFPLFVFVAVIFFTSRLAYKSEIVAMLNSGMSYNRFLRPYVIGAGLLAGSIFILNHYIIPKANRKRLNFENKYINFNSIASNTDLHLRIGKNEYIYLKSFNWSAKTGYSFTYEKIVGQQLQEKLFAENITWDSTRKLWKLSQVRIRTNNDKFETLKRLNTLEKKYAFTPKDVTEEFEVKQAMTTPELKAFIHQEELRANPALTAYRYERHRRTASSFSVIILSIIGACMSSQKIRGGSGVHLAIGLGLCGFYILFMQFASAFAIKGNMNPMIASWIPNIVFGVVAYYVYRRYTK